MTSLDDVRLGAQRPNWLHLPPNRAQSAANEVAEVAALTGLVLDDWQMWWLDNACAENVDGEWCAKENVLICARQSGKNGILEALELAALFEWNEQLIIHSAHEVPTALAHFHKMVARIEGAPKLSSKVKRISYTNGKESIELKSGAQLQFRARGKNSGRGLTAGRLVFDEAFKIPAESMGALLPTMRAVPNSTITYASSAPKFDSTVLQSLINRGRAGDPADRLFYAEWGNPPGTAMDDVDAWYVANPAMGIRITEATLHDEYRTLVSGGDPLMIAEFAREAVGIGEDPRFNVKAIKLPADKWAATVGPDLDANAEIDVISFDVDVDGAKASIAIASGSLSSPYVEVIDHRDGVGWLPARLAELVLKFSPTVVGVNGAGPAGAQVGPVLAAFAEAGISAELLEQLNTNAFKQACGGFYSDVVEGRLRRPAGQGPLDVAAGDAAERVLGDAWAWDRRSSAVPISPLVAVTVARALLPTTPAETFYSGSVFDLDDFLED